MGRPSPPGSNTSTKCIRFSGLFAQQEKGKPQRHWASYCPVGPALWIWLFLHMTSFHSCNNTPRSSCFLRDENMEAKVAQRDLNVSSHQTRAPPHSSCDRMTPSVRTGATTIHLCGARYRTQGEC